MSAPVVDAFQRIGSRQAYESGVQVASRTTRFEVTTSYIPSIHSSRIPIALSVEHAHGIISCDTATVNCPDSWEHLTSCVPRTWTKAISRLSSRRRGHILLQVTGRIDRSPHYRSLHFAVNPVFPPLPMSPELWKHHHCDIHSRYLQDHRQRAVRHHRTMRIHCRLDLDSK